jgi:hypothetical protein
MKHDMELSNYSAVRSDMKAGDLIAFGGQGLISRIIKWRTRSPVSHVGVVMEIDDHGRVMVMESTSLGGQCGVQVNRLSKRVREYDGNVWWFPLRKQLDEEDRFWEFLWAQDGKKYDRRQVAKAAFNLPTHENYKRLFCSELVAGAYKAGGLQFVGNPSRMTPVEVCNLPIFADPYCQIKIHDMKPRRAV